MQFRDRKVLYEKEELSVFVPLWTELSKDREFKAFVERMRDSLLVADEASIMNGTSPLQPGLERLEVDLRARARSIDPHLSEEVLRDLQFFCLYHSEDRDEFDFGEAIRSADRQRQSSD